MQRTVETKTETEMNMKIRSEELGCQCRDVLEVRKDGSSSVDYVVRVYY